MILRLAPRKVLSWAYVARLSLSTAIFVAAVLVWQEASPVDTLSATLIFSTVMAFTVASAIYTEIYRQAISKQFLYSQMMFDLMVVTMVVHLTWDGNSSLFAPLYILIIGISALVLPARGVWYVSLGAIALYGIEALAVQHGSIDVGVVLQLLIFGIVALGSGYIAARLREAGMGQEALAEQLARFRLKQGDVERLHLRAERLQAVAELSASMAHEIKNPLASIRSAVEQMSTSQNATDDEKVLAALVQRESDRLSRLLSRFLDFARVDTPALRLINVVSILRHAIELAKTHPDAGNGVQVQVDISQPTLEVRGDEDALHRAFFNLLLNAFQASPENGIIRVEATTVLPHQIESHAPVFSRGAIAVRIVDQGGGISDLHKDKLFHPFYTTKLDGSGLGLAIVHRAIDLHKGVVVVENDNGGASFTILLPQP